MAKISRTLAAVALLAILGGCQNYLQGSEKRTVGEVMDDTAIHTKVKSALVADHMLNGLKINVEVNRGVVGLYGRVKTDAQREQAVAVVRDIAGIKDVQDELTVDP